MKDILERKRRETTQFADTFLLSVRHRRTRWACHVGNAAHKKSDERFGAKHLPNPTFHARKVYFTTLCGLQIGNTFMKSGTLPGL